LTPSPWRDYGLRRGGITSDADAEATARAVHVCHRRTVPNGMQTDAETFKTGFDDD
jgi:hypothetical protein